MGGPGAGKSTTAAWLFSELKRRGYSVELISEYVKGWVYLNRVPKGFDQVYLLGKQLHYENKVLTSGIKNLVTDSPLFLGHIYCRLYSEHPELWKPILEVANLYDQVYPSVSIYLERGEKIFRTEGRWGTLDGARKVDEAVFSFVKDRHANDPDTLLISNWNDREAILEFAEKHLTK